MPFNADGSNVTEQTEQTVTEQTVSKQTLCIWMKIR